jgi:hypothetical protein
MSLPLKPDTALAAAEMATEKAWGLIRAVFGPAAEETGLLLKDKVSAKRHQNLVKIAVRARDILEEAGLSPKEVPLSIIHPLLGSAMLEDNDELQSRWAALLANTSILADCSLRSFAEILKQLTPVEVRFLDKAYDEALLPREWGPPNLPRPKVYPVLEGTLHLLRTSMIVNLERLGLITRSAYEHEHFTSAWGYTVTASSNRLWVSPLGIEFVRACRPPAQGAQPRS